MGKIVNKSLNKLYKSEDKILNYLAKERIIKQKIYEKVPQRVLSALELAFIKAFEKIFSNGAIIIEKTFDKENIILEHQANNFILEKNQTRKMIKRLDKPATKTNFVNHVATTTMGLGLGFLGLGLPDIPLFVGTVLRSIYEVALNYGFSYDSDQEKIYILRLIRVSLLDGNNKKDLNKILDLQNYDYVNIKQEIQETAKLMSNELLVEKFIQGLPIVGIVGGVTNWITYRKISKLSIIKYKKRYLEKYR